MNERIMKTSMFHILPRSAKRAKKKIKEAFPDAKVSPSYSYLEGKYYSGVIYDGYNKIPAEITANPFDRGLVCVCLDEKTGEIETFKTAMDMFKIILEARSSIKKW